MKYFRWKQVGLGTAMVLLSGLCAGQSKAPGGQSFSAQAKRGQGQYVRNCAMCHAPDLTGREPAPALTGAAFIKKWQGKSLWDLYEKVRKTMPQQNKGSLSPRTYLDIVAYMAKFNSINTGSAELKSDPQALKAVVIKKGAGKREAAAAAPAQSM